MQMFHGVRYYAVHSRSVGTFGGRAKAATLKIYDGQCANSPLFDEIPSDELLTKLQQYRRDRAALQSLLEQVLAQR